MNPILGAALFCWLLTAIGSILELTGIAPGAVTMAVGAGLVALVWTALAVVIERWP